ncbi:PREDICTED: uncharacterized protein LOC104810130 [Tarenaya hassleriana]|uniref:uncharacterized protein LOC104810130 n=1 Tax=Tarenaya hassleriana TaxID=28532 RepID=UPI00053C1762|nr:PREDICTED: uncharacterized protein LOC104810130 [Tarenaya hassleriana]
MESSAALGSLHQTIGSLANSQTMVENSTKVHLHCGNWPVSGNSLVPHRRFNGKRNFTLALSVQASKTSTTTETGDSSDASASKVKKTIGRLTFPNELEALVHEVCDDTEVAELKLKVGDFEMHLKRKIGEITAPAPLTDISPTVAPPIPSEPMNESAPTAAPIPSKAKSSSEKATPFMNTSFGKSSKLASLEASGSNNYVLVTSPGVGTYQRNRAVKGKKQAPSCKEGDVIKEGQVIGFLHQLGTELPVKSDVAGEVLKVLCDDGDSVGYGDPLVAILPSFHDINIM